MKNLVLFDFDGTLTKKDSLLQFLFYFSSKPKVLTNILFSSPILILGFMGLYDNGKIKEKLLSNVFEGIKNNEINQRIESFLATLEFKKEVLRKLQEHVQANDEVVIVSASLDIWLKPFAKKNNVELLCTEWDFEHNCFATPNCNKKEKSNRILQKYNLDNFSKVIAYGNSKGDQEMMKLANQKFWV